VTFFKYLSNQDDLEIIKHIKHFYSLRSTEFFQLKLACAIPIYNGDCSLLKGRVHCFSMQVVMYKCFLLNPEKKISEGPSCRFREKCEKRTFISEK